MKESKANVTRTVGLLRQFGDREAMREHLILRPLNYDDNERALENGVYRRIGDIALVLYLSLGSNEGNGGNIVSAMVPREIVQRWGAEEAEILEEALANTMRLQPPVFCRLIGGSHVQVRRVRFMEEDANLDFNAALSPILTTVQEINGAIAAFYPGVLERLREMVGGDFYLVFTSIHDVHIHPVGGWAKVSSMRTSLADTNREMNRREEILTRQVYRYDGESKTLTLA